jgi:AAA+ superfamily predicted ATPase
MTKSHDLTRELAFLRGVITARLRDRSSPPFLTGAEARERSRFDRLCDGQPLTSTERVVLALALAPHLCPDLLTGLVAEHLPDGGDLPEFGGVRGQQHRGVLPTGETAQFVLAGDDLAGRLEVQRLLSSDHWFANRHVLWLDPVPEGEPVMSGRLVLSPEVIERLTTGRVRLPHYSTDFPADHIETQLDWDDVVLHPDTLRQITEIEHWVRFNETLLGSWGMRKWVKPGFRALFHGPPGTGKTLTASLLGKYTNRPVFRIDLSRVVSKYIGETEKNLARLFDRAEHKSWILFFDEADALFGKRTEIRDAHDKYANQEVAYLLQRIENHSGLLILATNQRGNIDEAFLRRFQAVIHFPMPRAEDRRNLWRRAFPSQIEVANDVDWPDISSRFVLTGAGIVNVAQFCAIEALARSTRMVDRAFLESAIVRELVKEGKVV